LVRNPKEIICSGYLYHKKCKEKWAIKKNGNYYSYWKDNHFTKESLVENKKYLDFAKSFSNAIPYQKKLQNLSLNGGIIISIPIVVFNTNNY